MTISGKIGAHVPHLRRLARYLCGDQKSGDACVARLLERLIVAPDVVPKDLDPHAALCRALLEVWNSADWDMVRSRELDDADAGLQRTLGAITPKPRQAFLLSAVERFSVRQIAEILETDEQGVADLLTVAGREIAQQVATDVLIIEDEPLIAMDLADIAESLGHRVVGKARTYDEAMRAIGEYTPGLLLVDVKLADGSSGLVAVNEILQKMSVPVIFITAYPERLLTGERPEPTFLIAKPFETDTVKAIISQALFFDTRPNDPGLAR